MNIVYKILLFSILSISLPIGKLFEIFIWNDQIIKTEIVSEKQRLASRGRICPMIDSAKNNIGLLGGKTVHCYFKGEIVNMNPTHKAYTFASRTSPDTNQSLQKSMLFTTLKKTKNIPT